VFRENIVVWCSDIKMVIQVIICEQTNLNRGRSSTVFGSDCLIEMHWIHLRGCTIVPRFTIKQLRARTSSRILLSFPNGQGFNSRYLDVFPKNIIVYLQGFYLKNRVARWGCDWDPNIIMCELTFWQTSKVMERAKWHFHRHNFQLTGCACQHFHDDRTVQGDTTAT